MLGQIALDDCQRQPGLKALLLRKAGKAAKEGFEDLRAKIQRTTKHEWHRGEGIPAFPNGSRIIPGRFTGERPNGVDGAGWLPARPETDAERRARAPTQSVGTR